MSTMRARSLGAAALFAALAATAQQGAQQQPDLNQMLNALGSMLGGGTNAAAQVSDFRALKALLPPDLGALKRKEASGQKQSTFGMTVATAEGRYADDAGASIEIKLSDFGGGSAMVGAMQYGWASMEVDKETDTGFERTTTIAGHKAIEKYDTAGKHGETQVLVNKRFMVEVKGRGVTAEAIRDAVGKLDLDKLAALGAAPAK